MRRGNRRRRCRNALAFLTGTSCGAQQTRFAALFTRFSRAVAALRAALGKLRGNHRRRAAALFGIGIIKEEEPVLCPGRDGYFAAHQRKMGPDDVRSTNPPQRRNRSVAGPRRDNEFPIREREDGKESCVVLPSGELRPCKPLNSNISLPLYTHTESIIADHHRCNEEASSL